MVFGKREVFMTMEMEKYVKAKEVLERAGIQYTTKTKSSGGYSAVSHRMGPFGENLNHSFTYYIYTDKEDEDKAKYYIRNELWKD